MNRAAITGMGAITPIGCSAHDFAEALFAGKTGFSLIDRFDVSQLPTRFAAHVTGVTPEWRDVKIDFALLAARQAMMDAFPGRDWPSGSVRFGMSLGLGLELFSLHDLAAMRLPGFSPPETFKQRLTFLNTPSDLCVHLIADEFGMGVTPEIHVSACSAATDAIGSAMLAIRRGHADVVLAGGTDSMINPLGVGGFCKIGAMSVSNDDYNHASRPFDKKRDGFVLGEGAAFVVVESERHAEKRGAQALAYVAGYGSSMDAYSASDPPPDGRGALAAMRAALASARMSPDVVSAVSAHGTSTPKNDPAECAAIRTLLGPRVHDVPVFATKSMIGHLISAAGAAEVIAAVECLRRQQLHPTVNLQEPADDCQVTHVIGAARPARLEHILKNTFAFGGQNACLVISRA
jgi:3-oxoacyl-[acyl-carrier-protein] synthase II